MLVHNGKADAFIGHIATSLHYIAQLHLDDLKFSGKTEFNYEHRYLIQRDNNQLLSILNKALKSITQKEIMDIDANWIRTTVEKKSDYTLLWQVLFGITIIFLLFSYRHYKLKLYSKEMSKLKERLELALEGNNDGIWDWNLIDNTKYYSPRYKAMIGYKPNENVPKWEDNIHKDDVKKILKRFNDYIGGKINFYRSKYRIKHRNGSWIWVIDRGQKILNKNGQPIRILGTNTDITKEQNMRLKLEEQKKILNHLAHHDYLTGLPNRILFNDRLHQSIKNSKRDNKKFALFFLDLDRFKQINDSLGHEVGDIVLKKVGNIILDILRDNDTLARLGGDEFTIIIEDLKKNRDAVILANKIIDSLKNPIYVNNHKLYISTSIGISLFPNDSTNSENLLKYADSAMYKAKEEGRNNFQFYSSDMTEIAFERVAMETSLRNAIKDDGFLVFYQPKIDAYKNTLVGMEALVRWNHPSMGIVSPEKFISLAEETDLIVDIDKLVMQKAMKQISTWYKQGLHPGILSLNLAMKQLQCDDFIKVLSDCMAQYDFKSQWLELEITESKVMQKPEEMTQKLSIIHEMGIRIAIDDFGTGYSSLSYLKKLPIDVLKIDQSFIRDILNNEEDAAIVKAIIALAKSLNLEIVSEGVEHKEQEEFLLKNNCHIIQGYLYSKPIDNMKFKKLFL